MGDLDIKIYGENFVSIQDLTNDLKISDVQWDTLFTTTIKLFDNIYFNGSRIWAIDSNFDNIINDLSEETFIDTRKNHFEILFRIKNTSVMYNRRLVSKMWDYYEYPSFIFLDDKRQEEILIQAYKKKIFVDDVIEKIEGLLIMYRSFQPDVLWLKGNIEINKILSLAGFSKI